MIELRRQSGWDPTLTNKKQDTYAVCTTCGAHLGAFHMLPITTAADGSLYVTVEHCGTKCVFPAVLVEVDDGSKPS